MPCLCTWKPRSQTPYHQQHLRDIKEINPGPVGAVFHRVLDAHCAREVAPPGHVSGSCRRFDVVGLLKAPLKLSALQCSVS